MQNKILIATALVGFALASGCSGKAQVVKQYSKAESRQVALMPYSTNAIIVAGTTTWYYGKNSGLAAYPIEGGLAYVELANNESGIYNNPDSPATISLAANSSQSNNLSTSAAEHNGGNQLAGTQSIEKSIKPISLGKSPLLDIINSDEFELQVSLQFESSSSTAVYVESMNIFKAFLAGIKSGEKYIAVGFTDDVGQDESNVPLSIKRAEFVVKKIKEANPDVSVSGYGGGSSIQVADNLATLGRRSNRRVEIYKYIGE